MDIGNHVVHDRLHDAQRATTQHRALVVQPAHQHLGAAIHGTQHVGVRHFDVVKHQLSGVAAAHAQFVELLGNAEPLRALLNEERGDAASAQFRLALGIDHQGVGIRAIGDPHLVAVEQVVAAFVLGLELHGQHVRACARLTHGQGTHVLTADQLGQVPCALFGCAVALDLVHTQVAVCAVGQPHRGRCAGNLFHCNHVRQVTHIGAAVLLADGNAQHAQAAHLLPQVHGKLVCPVDLSRARCDLGLCKFTHRVAQCVDVFAELEIESG